MLNIFRLGRWRSWRRRWRRQGRGRRSRSRFRHVIFVCDPNRTFCRVNRASTTAWQPYSGEIKVAIKTQTQLYWSERRCYCHSSRFDGTQKWHSFKTYILFSTLYSFWNRLLVPVFCSWAKRQKFYFLLISLSLNISPIVFSMAESCSLLLRLLSFAPYHYTPSCFWWKPNSWSMVVSEVSSVVQLSS